MISAEFMDIFGVIGFLIILFIGIKLKKRKKVNPLDYNLLIIIGLIGLIVDFTIVLSKFILK